MRRQQAKAGNKRSRSATIAETLEGEYDFENEHDPREVESDEDDLGVNETVAQRQTGSSQMSHLW